MVGPCSQLCRLSRRLALGALAGLAAPFAVAASGPVGQLQYVQAYEAGVGNQTVTELPNGQFFLYGARLDAGVPQRGTMLSARNRHELNAASSVLAGPRVWDPAQRSWTKVAPPPSCAHNSLLATATALPTGQVLIAGGLCDRPRLLDDASAHVPHTGLALWSSSRQQWDSAPALSTSRIYHSASVLADGSVLIVGGTSDPLGSPPNLEPVLKQVEAYRDGRVLQVAPLQQARAKHSATVLQDGSVLVAGGFDANGQPLASAELWDPAQRQWSALAPLQVARHSHSAVLLGDGRLMLAGGVGLHGEALGSVEIWDPASRSWAVGTPLLLPVAEAAATRLKTGDVLLLGGVTLRGEPLPMAMLWEHSSGHWQSAGAHAPVSDPHRGQMSALLPLPDGTAVLFGQRQILRWFPREAAPSAYPVYGEREQVAMTPLLDGRVLLSGGRSGAAFIDAAELFDPATARFSATGRMQFARHSHTALTLDDGRVVVAGGWARTAADPVQPADYTPEVWDARTGRWSALSDIRLAWQERVTMGKLRDGTVLFLASREWYDKEPDGPLAYRAWLWNPSTGQARVLPVPLQPRARAAIAVQADGTVLVAAGETRVWVPEIPCSPSTETVGEVTEDRCEPEPAHWQTQAQLGAEVWNSSSGVVFRTADLPSPGLRGELRALALRNGNVLVAAYEPPQIQAPEWQQPAWVWDKIQGRWSALPALPSHATRHLLELADGTLLAGSLRLAPGAGAWAVVSGVQADDATPLALQPQPVVSLSTQSPYLAVLAPQRHAWVARLPADAPPHWRSKPALAALRDGRLMAIAQVEAGRSPVQTAQVWDPARDSWTDAGKLARRYSAGQALALPSGRVVHLGVFDAGETVCELGRVEDSSWQFCGTLQRDKKSTQPLILAALADGRAALLSGPNEAMVFNESNLTWVRMPVQVNPEALAYGSPIRPTQGYYGRVLDPATGQAVDASALLAAVWQRGQPPGQSVPDALWDPRKLQWAYVLARGKGLGRDAVWLPDGCALSLQPARRFDPRAGEVLPLGGPPLGPQFDDLAMAVLTDGRLVAASAGYRAPPGTGFFHRKASCAGLQAAPQDAWPLPPGALPASAAAAASEPDVPLATVRQWRLRFNQTMDRLVDSVARYRWIMLAIVGALAGYALLRYALLPLLKRVWQAMPAKNGKRAAAPKPSAGFRWAVRAILYVVAAAIGLPLLITALGLHQLTQADACAAQASACLDPQTGRIKRVATLQTGQADGSDSTRLPCRYIGVWSSIRPGAVRRITLLDDGRYTLAAEASAAGDPHGGTGYWAVQGRNMLWLPESGGSVGLDINPIVDEAEARFTLIEANGSQTRFELIERVPSQQCVP